jgi:hypothetical protein
MEAEAMIRFSSRLPWSAAVLCAALLVDPCGNTARAIEFPGPDPQAARARVDGEGLVLENRVLACKWKVADGKLLPECVVDKLSGRRLALDGGECFGFLVARSPSPEAEFLKASDLRLTGGPAVTKVKADPESPRLAERLGGQEISVEMASPDGALAVEWKAVLRDGANYVRQHVRIRPTREPVELRELVLAEWSVPEAKVVGGVDGSPVVVGNFFVGYEHPVSRSSVTAGGPALVRCTYPYPVVVEPERPLKHTLSIGVVPEGQLRRGFLYYLERERACAYRPFLHYNNGSEIGCEYWQRKLHGKPGEAEAFRRDQERVWLEGIEAFGRELVAGRGVTIDAFVHDFEWDDETKVWEFHEGYPRGFAPAREAAERHGASVGVWLSPWGGYPGKSARVESGKQQGRETDSKGLSLAGPRYYARVRGACAGMIREYGVSYFKFDGFAAGNNQPGPGAFASDAEGLLRLIAELRGLDPEVFVNPSTGSWPSPFWLFWADSIWRQGSDTNLKGKGSLRQRWITYRDGEVYHGIVTKAPLYPISSLMIHGVFVNRLPLSGNPYDPASKPPTWETPEIVAEIRSFFASGTNLQELYVEPELMTAETWDALAEAARWSRENRDVLADTHWIGGDPAHGEVYGWASWSKRKGILALRNPDEEPSRLTLDIGRAFELPAGAPQKYVLESPWAEDAAKPAIAVEAGRPHTFRLEPFEVLVWDAVGSR